MRRGRGSGRRVARWVLGGTGPLKRGSDRVETAFRVLLLLAVVVAVPIGIDHGTATYGGASGTADQARDHRAVQAEVVAEPAVAEGLPPDAVVQAPVTWTSPTGGPAGATVPVFASTHAHDHITLWVSADGHLTGPPPEQVCSVGDAVWGGILPGLAVPVAAWAMLGVAHLTLDAHRSRQWQSEWLAVEPVWTSRRR